MTCTTCVICWAFTRATTRPAGQVRRLSKSRGSDRVGPGGVTNLMCRVASGRARRCFKPHVSGCIGSGRIRRFPDMTDQGEATGQK